MEEVKLYEEKTLEERGRVFHEELKQLSEKHKMALRAIITRHGPQIEIFDISEQQKDDL